MQPQPYDPRYAQQQPYPHQAPQQYGQAPYGQQPAPYGYAQQPPQVVYVQAPPQVSKSGLSRDAHLAHGLLTLFTMGCWAPIWFLHALFASRRTTHY